jgi:hypothetical protein
MESLSYDDDDDDEEEEENDEEEANEKDDIVSESERPLLKLSLLFSVLLTIPLRLLLVSLNVDLSTLMLMSLLTSFFSAIKEEEEEEDFDFVDVDGFVNIKVGNRLTKKSSPTNPLFQRSLAVISC